MSNTKFVTLKLPKPDTLDIYPKTYYEFIETTNNTEYCSWKLYSEEDQSLAVGLTEKGLLETSLLLRHHHEKYPTRPIIFDDIEECDWLINKCLMEPIYPQGFGYEFLYSYQPVTHAGCRVLLNYRRIVRGLEKMEGDLRTNY